MLLLTKAKGKRISHFFSNPARVIAVSFAALILLGSLLLMLPIAAKSGLSTDFSSALFTATSATCVTGLIIFDTFTYFTTFGQLVILGLIQLGGLGLVTFATFFNVAIRKRVGLKSLYMAQESINSDNMYNMGYLLKLIFKITFSFEIIGATMLATVFVPEYGAKGIYISIFMAVSAYCNAGFDVLGMEGAYTGLTTYATNPVVLITVMMLIICGGLGFIVWQDIMHYRERKRFTLHTKLVLVGTISLILIGMILILIFEWNNVRTLGPMSVVDKFMNAMFHSVSSRTAGFNTFDIGGMYGVSKVVTIILMFIGAAPGGTGGGIKVTTFIVLITTVVCVIRGIDETVIDKHKVEKTVIYKAMAVVTIALTVVMIAAGTIFFTSHGGGRFSELDAIFEATSAFGTVGLTAGVTGIANTASRLLLTLTMFIGRVGPVSLALSLAMRPQNKSSVMPEAKIMVG